MSEFISTEKNDSLQQFFVKVNTDALLRSNFLENPIRELANAGLTLSPEAEKEVLILTKMLVQKVPDIAAIPGEYRPLLDDIAKSLEDSQEGARSKTYEDDPMLL